VRYASWDLTQVHLVDERTGNVLCRLYPQDKTHNAQGIRRPLEPVASRRVEPVAIDPASVTPATGIAPLLAQLMAQRTARGLPPAYLPKDELPNDNPTPDEGDDT
jgi:putative transposase